MAQVIAWRNIPGTNNLDWTLKHLADQGIAARGQRLGFSFAIGQPISVNCLWVAEEDLELAVRLIKELTSAGWTVHTLLTGDIQLNGDI